MKPFVKETLDIIKSDNTLNVSDDEVIVYGEYDYIINLKNDHICIVKLSYPRIKETLYGNEAFLFVNELLKYFDKRIKCYPKLLEISRNLFNQEYL